MVQRRHVSCALSTVVHFLDGVCRAAGKMAPIGACKLERFQVLLLLVLALAPGSGRVQGRRRLASRSF